MPPPKSTKAVTDGADEVSAADETGPGAIIAVRLIFSAGEGVVLVEREDTFSLFDVERFCWMNAGSMFEELGEFEGARELQFWASRADFDAWVAVPGNSSELAGYVGNAQIGYVGPLRLSDNAGA